jgi:DNA-binding transcriptional LysR family regulator
MLRNTPQLLAAIHRHGSFTATAHELGTSKSTLSRAIQDAEERIGQKLLQRTTRRVTLTEAGAALLRQAPVSGPAPLAAGPDPASTAGPTLLRVGLVAPLDQGLVARLLRRWLHQHPEITLEVSRYGRLPDLATEGLAVLFWTAAPDRQPPDAVILGSLDWVVVAAPSYLQRKGRPRAPGDLTGHDLVATPGQALAARWPLRGAGPEGLALGAFRYVGDDPLAAAVEGLGCALVPWPDAQATIESGALAVLLDGFESRPSLIAATFSKRVAGSALCLDLAKALKTSLNRV